MLTLTLPKSGGRSVWIVRLRTKATEFFYLSLISSSILLLKNRGSCNTNIILRFAQIRTNYLSVYRTLCSHRGGYAALYLVGYSAVQFCETNSFLPATCYLLSWFNLQPGRRRWQIPLKHRLTFAGLHGATSQNAELSTINYLTAVTIVIYIRNDSVQI
jgi:hypothetical protein